jgi:hypothetical protein
MVVINPAVLQKRNELLLGKEYNKFHFAVPVVIQLFSRKKLAFILHTRICADCPIQKRLGLPNSFICKARSMIHFVVAHRNHV